ncbi:MAG: SpoIIE family protein phosphatase [Clostridia bacterium]|nr:SpoIIE family protein phosphatase [Clostridia bacterium]
MSLLKKLRRSLSFNIIAAIVLVLVFFSAVVTTIGYISFIHALEKEYNETTFAICDTAASLFDADKLDEYLATKGQTQDYKQALRRMDNLCDKMNVSLIYVIQVDTSDYNSFTSILNSINPETTDYIRWEIGYKRQTTNDEYKEIYKRLYTKETSQEYILRTSHLNGAPPHITSLIPVKNSKDDVVGVLCVQRPLSALEAGRKPYLASVAASVVITSVLVAFFVVNFFSKQFTKPIRCIKDEAKRFSQEQTLGKRDKLTRLSKIDDIEILANSIEKMEQDTLSYIDNLTAATSEKERIGAELNVAKNIQENSIPNTFPAFPDKTQFDIYASMTPAKEVGGDFYDFFFIDDHHLGFTMADVSGKGVPAALFMMVTKILIKERSTISGGTPAEILEFVNSRICENNSSDMFVTVWFGILDIHTGTVTAANAGHDDPAVYRKDKGFSFFNTKHGLVIGALENCKYHNYEIHLKPGDKIFLYTDGVTEATNEHDELFTAKNLLKTLNTVCESSPEEILKEVKTGIDRFVGYVPQFDDLTMLCLEFKGDNGAPQKALHIQANTANLDEVNSFLCAYLEAVGCPHRAQMQIGLAAEEIFTNISNYAYAPDKGFADIRLDCEENAVSIVFEDSGVPYDPLKKEDPDITLSAGERQIGGLGIYMTKKLMDDVQYEYKDNKNILKLIKKF